MPNSAAQGILGAMILALLLLLQEAVPVTPEGQFTEGIEGPACDREGNVFAVNFGKQPSNLCFGGPDGKTVYVTEVEKRRLVSFRAERPGLEWQRWQEK